MIGAHDGTESKSIVCRIVISAILFFGTSSTSPEIRAHIDIARPQKYLVRDETTSDDFLRCRGEYGNDAVKSLRVDLTLNGAHGTIPMAPNSSARYVFECAPPMPRDKQTFLPVVSAYCTLGIVTVSAAADVGRYMCEARGNSSGAGNVGIELQVYDKFILNTTEPNPKIVEVNETNDVVLRCRINQQKNLNGLLVRWKRSGSFIENANAKEHAEKVSSRGGTFNFELESAEQNDAGVYQCVIVSQDGDKVIDSDSEIELIVNYSPSVRIFPTGKKLTIPYRGKVDLVCKADGSPRPNIFMLRNGDTLPLNQENDTVTLEIRDATDKNDGYYSCKASNILGSAPDAWLSVDVEMPPDITSLKFDKNVDDCFPEDETVTLECMATGLPPPTVKLFDRDEKEVGAGTGEASCSIHTSSNKDGNYACRATSRVGPDERKELAFCVRVGIVFGSRTMPQHQNDTCLPEGSSLRLCCTASAGDNSLETIQIATSEGSPVASSDSGMKEICVDVKKSDNYTCFASTAHSSSQEHLSVCIDDHDDDDDENTEAIVGEAVGGVLFFLLIVVVVPLIIKKPISCWKKDPEKKRLIGDFVPSSKEQIEFVSAMLSRDWEVLRDFCRAIVPPFEEGESFIEAIEEARRAEKNHAVDDVYWATRCLTTWIEENPEKDFISAVYDALRKGIEDKKLARQLCERFPRPTLGESIEMSPCASPLAFESV